MFRRLTFVCLAAICVEFPIGCCTPYWHVGLGQNGTAYSPSVVQQHPGPVTVSGLGAHAIEGVTTRPGRFEYMPTAEAPSRGPTLAARASCTMDEVCAMLERIERRLSQQAAPMPKPNEEEE